MKNRPATTHGVPPQPATTWSETKHTLQPVTGVFYTVVKQSHLLYEAIEITVQAGLVVSVRNISRAPDLAQTAVAACQRSIWEQLRVQTKEGVLSV